MMIINPYVYSAGPAGDPYFSNVTLLMHMDGANNGTVFTDSSTGGLTPSVYGSPVTVTAEKKYGTASLQCDGSSALYFPANTRFDFGSGDFTIELFAKFNSVTGARFLLSRYNGSAIAFALFQNGSTVEFYASADGVSWNLVTNLSLGTTFTTGVWYHLAVTRQSNTFRAFRDGALISTLTGSGSVAVNSAFMQIGGRNDSGGSFFSGWIDELRITKGVARYTAGFTPPVAPFPNF